MTNLNGTGSSWLKHLTRQRVMVGAPFLVGALIGTGLFAMAGLPHLLALGERARRITELQAKEQSLPLIEVQVKEAQQKFAADQQQQDLVVSLVAGRGQIATFLTQLSRTAAESGVVIDRYEPVSIAPVVPDPRQPNNNQDETKDNPPPELKGYQKTAVLLQVSGPYQGVHEFLRGMEQLELLVQPSDLELNAVPPETGADGAPALPALTKLKLRLSFFDQSPEVDPSGAKPTITSSSPL